MTDLRGLDPRRDLARIRETLQAQLERGVSPEPYYDELSRRDPVALADLAVGPRALQGDLAVRAALSVLPVLEATIQPASVYRRLAALSDNCANDVLSAAVENHTRAPWLIALGAAIEGRLAGATQLCALAGHPAFEELCEAHAAAGHADGLVEVAAATGFPDPAVALVRAGLVDAAARAAARALERDPLCPIVPWLAATWGPEVDPLVVRVVPHLRGLAAIRALSEAAAGLSLALAALAHLDPDR